MSHPGAAGARAVARRALACLDLTSLNDGDTRGSIDALCDSGLEGCDGIRPVALCVYPRFAQQVSRRLTGTGIGTAVVVNFPGGDCDASAVGEEVRSALGDGATEIDVVLPYRHFLQGDIGRARSVVSTAVEVAHGSPADVIVKVILESGAFDSTAALAEAALLSVDCGADFLKTSTGKIAPGATPEAARVLIAVAAARTSVAGRRAGAPIGVKVSGGVRTVEDAGVYLALADAGFAPRDAAPENFRFGASGLLDDIRRTLSGEGSPGDGHGSTRGGY